MAALILSRPDELFLCVHRWIPLVLSLSKVNISVVKVSAYTRCIQAFVVNMQHVCKSGCSHVCTHLFIDVSICIMIVLTSASTNVQVSNSFNFDAPKDR